MLSSCLGPGGLTWEWESAGLLGEEGMLASANAELFVSENVKDSILGSLSLKTVQHTVEQLKEVKSKKKGVRLENELDRSRHN